MPSTEPAPVDPRPRVSPVDGVFGVDGYRCAACAYPVAIAVAVCPSCQGPVEPARFGPDGTVWSSTVLRIPVPGRPAPYVVAYVDLHGGPRVLAHVGGDRHLPVGTPVRLTAPGPGGDVTVSTR
ncbi:Zn-ribbon domain-containing OB-fold protein [Acrocarpospora catenulata]|uniref:Zn-ribbon domain-containing OB-fold protein n=1 Tax=Acrocarpospora catenulata TaxID=2836182 RepID=UPI001BDA7DC9|nr:OB-fold domain-containing protein [Acrocarpospora catenulata]